MSKILSDSGMDTIFRQARTFGTWAEGDVSEVLLQAVYDLAKFGPTSANCSPMERLEADVLATLGVANPYNLTPAAAGLAQASGR